MNWIVLSAVAHFRRWIARNGAFAAGLLIPLVIAYGAALKAHMKRSSSPFVFNEDVRQQIFPFFQYHEAGLFPHDYFGPYFRACFLPPGYRALYRFGAIVADPAGISKVLPYFLLVATVIAVAVAARPLAGYFGALLAAALVVQSDILLDRMVGGLPRAFAFPTLALTATALVWGRPRLLAGIVCASASFYPVAAVPGAIALMLWLFVLPARDRGEAANWCFARRTRLAIVTASISALILLPMLVGARAYGRTLGPSDVIEYPEIANGGRYGTETIVPPFETFAKAAFELARRLFTPVGEPWLKNVREWAKTRAQSGTNSNGDVVLELVTVALLVGGVLVVTQG